VEQDSFYQMDVKTLPGIYDKPAYLYEYADDPLSFEPKYETPRDVIAHGPYFSTSGKALFELKALYNKDRWIALLDPAGGELQALETQHDDAWIGGPGIVGWNSVSGTLGWMPDDKTIYFQSVETGFSHLYLLNTRTGDKRGLTNGKFEILSAELARNGEHFYIRSNKESPHEQHFYHLEVKSGKMKRLTDAPGNYEVRVSPDEAQLAIRYSSSNQPWELFLMPNQPGAEAVQVTQSTTEAFRAYDWRVPEIVYFEAADGAEVPARIYRPDNPAAKGPAVIFVHGAGYLQNVHRWWSSYYREYMFHNLLTDNGYTVLDIDYRASRGYGRNWRTAIYRHMGGKDLSDQVDGARFLVESYDIDPERIGIYGGSYGGFITLMALFQHPGTFNCGAALRSVTDWAHYNHPYTSNILNTPSLDSLAYRRSSPIYFAEGLQDNLLILHGMIDQNVQFQDVVRLAQRLIELGKDNWEFAVFPLERHGFVEPSSWTDEYKRIFKLFQTHLQ
ncbi:MAG: S9 family peptidase, partial [Phaeodactylibacter sp.]|nr:S9 family peptidase [Phaeodactylibacter sp.]